MPAVYGTSSCLELWETIAQVFKVLLEALLKKVNGASDFAADLVQFGAQRGNAQEQNQCPDFNAI